MTSAAYLSEFGTNALIEELRQRETTALLLAIEDYDADSGAWAVDAYLDSEFLEGELRKLAGAADVLADRAWKAYQRKRAQPDAD